MALFRAYRPVVRGPLTALKRIMKPTLSCSFANVEGTLHQVPVLKSGAPPISNARQMPASKSRATPLSRDRATFAIRVYFGNYMKSEVHANSVA